ncbi:aldose 1-epimerase [Variovorax sp. OK605]|uniref:aldose 1-epimerase n=1 Tax=Variovorax sp. OK605 TaxID=1855317 RepID=UPI0008E5FE94|nr:aldose 1-epimerase [Variovorax sp. OK605]SFP62423.1 aldose 1-epimerase [Variovorax sp. OK605]
MSEIIELRSGVAFARVAPALGARITRCVLQSSGGMQGTATELLHPYPEDHSDLMRWAKGGIYPLIPYWGRISQARLRHAGKVFALAPHPDALPHTLHGTAHQACWAVTARADDSLALGLRQPADAHWPWPYEAELVFTLSPGALHIALAVTNTGCALMPAGIGLHPYLARQGDTGIQFTAARRWLPTADYLATAAGDTTKAEDFSRERRLGDAPFTMFYSAWNGEARVTARAGADGCERSSTRAVHITASPTLDHLVLHQPPGAPYVCLEPASHTADAFNLAAHGIPGTGTRVLAPGERLSGWVAFHAHSQP